MHLFSRLVLICLFAAGNLGSVALAAGKNKKEKKETADSAPVLLSRTGGGNTWSDLAELQAAAQKGNPKAEAQLGELLWRGEGVTQDRQRALSLLEKAARASEGSAAFRIGMLLDDGDGVKQDRERALAYFRAAAAGGVAEAFHNLGAAYASARGVKRDYVEALGWLILAGKHGADARAETALREHIQELKRPEWIAAGERRATEIEQEFARRKMVEFLPSASPLLLAESPPAAGR